jgi:ABC-type transporter MlaC component
MARTVKCLFLALAVAFSMGRSAVFADTPTEQIQETIRQVATVVNGSKAMSAEERRDRLKEALMPRFDWVEMAKQALGKHWNTLPGRQYEFVAAFAEFLGNSYVSQIASYKDEKIGRCSKVT